MTDEPVAIIGAGRMGRGVSLALRAAGVPALLLGRERSSDDVRAAALVLIAVPDDAIGAVAAELSGDRAIEPRHVVLHLSGLLDRHALHSLADTGAGLGSFHPLQSIADSDTAAIRLRGAYAALEGDPRALEAGEQLAHALGMRTVRLAPGAKAAYHAGAVFASNYVVVLASAAADLAEQAGIDRRDAEALYLPLMVGTVANLSQGPAAALTGPVRRGDSATVERHLSVLSPGERELYRALGLRALELARQSGLDEAAAAAVERALRRPA